MRHLTSKKQINSIRYSYQNCGSLRFMHIYAFGIICGTKWSSPNARKYSKKISPPTVMVRWRLRGDSVYGHMLLTAIRANNTLSLLYTLPASSPTTFFARQQSWLRSTSYVNSFKSSLSYRCAMLVVIDAIPDKDIMGIFSHIFSLG